MVSVGQKEKPYKIKMIVNNNAPVDADYALRNFPNIDIDGFEVTSELNPFYNCFAWARGENTSNVEPPTSKYVKWHNDNTAWTIENFLDNFANIGFTETTESADLENGIEKVAIYVTSDGEPSHASLQKESGKWTSKLGIREDIEHSTPYCVENDTYGKVKIILKRKKMDIGDKDIPNKKSKE